jgi:molybdopterin synthase sulfur carrier subunit
MPSVVVGSMLARWLDSSGSAGGQRTFEVAGNTLREALEAVFTREPQLRGYVLDELGVIRHHVVLFVDGAAVSDREQLHVPLAPDSEIHILQALSGG